MPKFCVLATLSAVVPSAGYLIGGKEVSTELFEVKIPGNRNSTLSNPVPQQLKAGLTTFVEDQIFASYCRRLEEEAAALRTQYRRQHQSLGGPGHGAAHKGTPKASKTKANSSVTAMRKPEAFNKAKAAMKKVAEGIIHFIPDDKADARDLDKFENMETLNGHWSDKGWDEHQKDWVDSDWDPEAVWESDKIDFVNETVSNDAANASGGWPFSPTSSSNSSKASSNDTNMTAVPKPSFDRTARPWYSTNKIQKKARLYFCDRLPEEYGGKNYTMYVKELKYLQCPPGSYMNNNDPEEALFRKHRLLDAICLARARGWKGHNAREGSSYLERGYYNFESNLWPKKEVCRGLPNETWARTAAIPHAYRPDVAPEHYNKEVCKIGDRVFEFHKSWKVASTAFPDYLACEYPCTWEQNRTTDPTQAGAIVAAAVRDPILRWLSAVGELLERAINHYCPNGPCDESDGWVFGTQQGSTLDKLQHTTTWYRLIQDGAGGFDPDGLPDLVAALVHDTTCNYYTYASEHLSTQANFVTQNSGPAANITSIVKLENLDEGLDQMYHAVTGRSESHQCKFEMENVQSCKPHLENVPSSEALRDTLLAHRDLVQELCLTYAQDFICFDYELPEACKDMF